MFTEEDIQTINTARALLKRVEEDATAHGWVSPPVIGEARAFDYGRLAEAADRAGTALFDVLNIARAYCKFDISDEDMHMHEKQVV